jgi:type IV secretory pathway protease TraF
MIEQGRFFVQGDNQDESTDSRHFGWLTKENIRGLVVSILA